MRRISLRFRLVLWFLCIETMTLVFFSFLLYELLSGSLYSHHDEALTAKRVKLLSELELILNSGRTLSEFSGQDQAEIVSSEGKLIAAGPGMDKIASLFPFEKYQHVKEAMFFTVEAEPNAIRFLVTPHASGKFFLVQTSDLGDITHTMKTLKLILGGLIPLVLISTSFGGYVIASRALRPVERIIEQTREIQVKNLNRRLDVETSDLELRELVDTLNGMMSRLDAAFHGMQQFTADASHELKTPLTIMSGTLEVALTQDREIKEYKDTIQSALDEAHRMSRIVHELLLLSSLDAGGTVKRVEMDLGDLCGRIFEMYEPLMEDREIRAELMIGNSPKIFGDPNRISQVLTNLLDNALRYTPQHGHISVDVGSRNGNAILQVCDTGAGIPATSIPHIFDRFYRVEKAGPRQDSGVGLGLAIVKRIVETHHGNITVQSREGQGTEFLVTFPAFKSQPN